jgi:hypothetical protein
MMTIKEAKANARILKTFMEEHGTTLAYGVYLEAVARLAHHKNWATFLVAANAVESLVKTFDEVASWPTFVFFYDEREENDLAEALYVLPQGVTLSDRARQERHGPFATHGALEVPDGFTLSDKTVATRVYSTAPSVDKYGLPHYADEDKAASFFREDLRCAAITAMDVSFTDTGDDSSSRYWFEARVHPDLAKTLDAHFGQPAPEAQAAAPVTDAELVEAAYSSAFAEVFVDVQGQSVKRVMDCLTLGAPSKNVAASAWLSLKLKVDIELEPPFAHLNCQELISVLRKKAMPVYDDMLLRALGH